MMKLSLVYVDITDGKHFTKMSNTDVEIAIK